MRDEVEFVFSSQPNDIAAGATRIARNFITVDASGPTYAPASATPRATST